MRVKLNVNMLQYECCIVPLHYSIIDYNWYEYNYVFISLLAAAGINPIYTCMTASSLVLGTHVYSFLIYVSFITLSTISIRYTCAVF